MTNETSKEADQPVSGRAAAERGRTKEQAKSTLRLAKKRGRLKQLAAERGEDADDDGRPWEAGSDSAEERESEV